jgi:hypothetical protein
MMAVVKINTNQKTALTVPIGTLIESAGGTSVWIQNLECSKPYKERIFSDLKGKLLI